MFLLPKHVFKKRRPVPGDTERTQVFRCPASEPPNTHRDSRDAPDRSVEYFLFPQLEAQNPPAVVLLDPLDDTGAGLNETFSPNTTR